MNHREKREKMTKIYEVKIGDNFVFLVAPKDQMSKGWLPCDSKDMNTHVRKG